MNALAEFPIRFLVTTPGLSATRWLSFVLASHSGVFVAHGKHPLTQIHGQFVREKHITDAESLTHGNLAAEFYQYESLDGIFAAYRELMPAARPLAMCIRSRSRRSEESEERGGTPGHPCRQRVASSGPIHQPAHGLVQSR
jgi:hypothetical protein